ncbi:MAG TPA: hypothetical protein PKV96_02090 [Candidatus Saccharimonas sp.]|jgi:hypothetical protein|nr:hypothetical protein [Candidatus Saccharimonas sp.]
MIERYKPSTREVLPLNDMKVRARATVLEFTGLTMEGLLLKPYSDDSLHQVVALYDEDEAMINRRVVDTPNRRLANAMIGLEEAVRTLCQVEPPIDRMETIQANREVVDGVSGTVFAYTISAGRAGCDFGTLLRCEYDTPGLVDSYNNPLTDSRAVLLPQNSYLRQVLRFGDPHEPVFRASETDLLSPEWSTVSEEWLPNGGKAVRWINLDRAYRHEDGTFAAGQVRDDIFHRDHIFYYPLYSSDALGLERYLEIAQDLLRKLLDALDGEHTVTPSVDY